MDLGADESGARWDSWSDHVSETEPPLLADVYPALVSFLDAAPVSEGESALAQIVGGLRSTGGAGAARPALTFERFRLTVPRAPGFISMTRCPACGFSSTGTILRSPEWRSVSSIWGLPRRSTSTGRQGWADPCGRAVATMRSLVRSCRWLTRSGRGQSRRRGGAGGGGITGR